MARVSWTTSPSPDERPEFSCPLKECSMEFKHQRVSRVLKHFKRSHPSEWILKCSLCKSYLSTSIKKMGKHINFKCDVNKSQDHHCTCRSSTRLNENKFQKASFPLQFRCTHCKFSTDSLRDFNFHFKHNCSTNSFNGMLSTVIKIEPDCEPEPLPTAIKDKRKISFKEEKDKTNEGQKDESDIWQKDESDIWQKDESDVWSGEGRRRLDPEDIARRAIHPCPICGKCFTRRRSIKPHMVVHTNERCFDCHLCPYKARRKGDLSLHVNKVHNQERPYSCTYCSKQFGFKSNLTRHLRLHTGVRPFKCDVCEKTFRRKHSIPKHMEIYHPVKERVKV